MSLEGCAPSYSWNDRGYFIPWQIWIKKEVVKKIPEIRDGYRAEQVFPFTWFVFSYSLRISLLRLSRY